MVVIVYWYQDGDYQRLISCIGRELLLENYLLVTNTSYVHEEEKYLYPPWEEVKGVL